MHTRIVSRPLFVGLVGVVALATGACSSSVSKQGEAEKTMVTSTENACMLSATTFGPGSRTFAVTNKGSDVTEVYVYGDGGKKVMGEVENIGPGTTRDFTVALDPGTYEVACKPGQKGDGIRTAITVTGDKSQGTALTKYDREVEFIAKGYSFFGLEAFTGKAGEAVEFKMKNEDVSEEHEFVLFGPNGENLGEIPETKPGETGEFIVKLAKPGTYTFKCLHSDHFVKGMTGTFTVT